MTSKLKTDVLETVSGSGTIALTNQLSGMTSASVPSGSVLQVVGYVSTAQVSQTITSSDTLVSDISKAITPLGANSKFLVNVRWLGEVTSSHDVSFNIQMDGTRVNVNGGGRMYGLANPVQSYTSINDSSTPENANFQTVVSTSSVIGTAITFRLVADCGSNRTMWTNRCFGVGNEQGTSEIIITEIKG
tara:strand:+ start:186 stop:752 length:567 start_codon:yes stop_codon:yes gene_type:complete